MKSLTVQLPDELYDRAERHAAERGATLHETVLEFVTRLLRGRGRRLGNLRFSVACPGRIGVNERFGPRTQSNASPQTES